MPIIDEEWIEIYNNDYVKNKMSLAKLHRKYGYAITTIHNNFRRLGLKCREIKENGRDYTYNYNYFDVIDTEDKAYFLGLMYSDGYVTGNSIGIALKSDDRHILEKFLECMDSNAIIRTYTNNGYGGKYNPTEYCRVLIRNQHLRDTLVNHGVMPNKSLKLLPPNIRDDLIRHFIRGFMDGDGSIYTCGKDNAVSFTGTTDMLNYIGDFFVENGIIKRYKLSPEHHSNVTYSLKIGGNIQCERTLDLLYKDATVYLERKHNRYLRIKENSHLIQ